MIDFFRNTPLRGFFERVDLTAYDIGARGGFDASLESVAWRVAAVAFEPERSAFEKLRAETPPGWRSFAIHPVAVSDRSGPTTLYVPAEPTGASLLERDRAVGERYGLEHLFVPVSQETVETLTLAQAVADYALPSPDFVKLDIEGMETRVIENARDIFESVSAVKSEAAFIDIGNGATRAHRLIELMENMGFEMMEIADVHDWRRGVVPASPYIPKAPNGYSKGRIAQGDLMFLRSPDALSARTALPAVATAIAMGYFDHAEDLIQGARARNLIAAADVPEPAVIHAVSRRYGRTVARKELFRRLRSTIPLFRSLLSGI